MQTTNQKSLHCESVILTTGPPPHYFCNKTGACTYLRLQLFSLSHTTQIWLWSHSILKVSAGIRGIRLVQYTINNSV